VQGCGHQQQRGLKRSEVLDREQERLGIHHRCQQVDRIPDAAMGKNTVERGKRCHGNASREAALDPGRDGVDLDGEPGPVHLGDDFDTCYFPPFSDDRHRFGHQRYALVLFVGQNLAEPTHTARHGQDRAQGTHRGACQQTGKK
jgi:hypothetical protein